MKFISKLYTPISIFRIYKYSALVLLLVMLVSAFSESLSLGMMVPFLETILKNNDGSEVSLKYLLPVLNYFPDHYRLMLIGVLIGTLILIKNIFNILKTWISSMFTLRFRELWMGKIMEKYIHAEYLFLLFQKQGVLLNNLIAETARAAKLLQRIIEFFSNMILAVFLYGLLLLVNWRITLAITIVAGGIVFLIRKVTYRYSLNVGNKHLAFSQEINAIAAENISAVRQIKIFSLENESIKKFSGKLNQLFRMILKFRVVNDLPNPVAESLVVIGFVFTLFYFQYINKSSLVGIIPTLALFFMVSRRFVPVVSTLYAEWMNILFFLPSLKLVHNLYVSDIGVEALESGKSINELKGDIIFDNVCFAYPNSVPFFNGLSLTIPKGKITAIVGPSGAGKSTIVDLLVGFLKNQKGSILINGSDLKEINLKSWRRLVGYISQDVFLFNASVRENILAGKSDASEEEIIDAAKKANADEFIRRLPQRYDTVLGDRGLTVSGGERQRIAIARVMIRNPEVLIFDEATSALDSETEEFIQKTINALITEKKTVIIIAHHLTMVKNADKIIVLARGEIVETGIHDELMKAEGDYSRLAKGGLEI